MSNPHTCPLCDGHGTVIETYGEPYRPTPNGEVTCPDCVSCDKCGYRAPTWYDMPDGWLACEFCYRTEGCVGCDSCEWVDTQECAA